MIDPRQVDRFPSSSAREPDGIELDRDEWFRGLEGRRQKAALVLFALWGGTMTLHYATWGPVVVWGLTAIAAFYSLRVLLARPQDPSLAEQALDKQGLVQVDRGDHSDQADPSGDRSATSQDWPSVSVLVSAKDEEAVVGRLVAMLCGLDYPSDRLDVWFVDDGSSDRTPQVLAKLQTEYPQLRVLRRPPNAGGGKSGALNAVIPKTKGEILAIFDADAQVQPDLLRRVVGTFARANVGAVQLRKAIVQAESANHPERNNLWIRGQEAEMALDCFFQQQRLAIGGIAELRGNGQFVRRSALDRCGGFNEETITDDLDLTVRLHLDGWDIESLAFPAVLEEGVTRLQALWHQRNRWAEGGYQRYLDYWRPIAQNRLGFSKSIDLILFWVFQYLIPQAVFPDTIAAILRGEPMALSPLLVVTFWLPTMGMFCGLRRAAGPAATWGDRLQGWGRAGWQTILGMTYMCHWFPTMASMGVRVAVRPKRLKWVKTSHSGGGELAIDLDDVGDGD